MATLPDLSRLKIGAATSPPSQPPPQQQSYPDFEAADLGAAEEYVEEAAEMIPKSAELIQKEEDARLIISLYKMKFGEELAALQNEFNSMPDMDLGQLEELRDRCDKILGASSGIEVKRKTFNAAIFVIEKVGCMSGVHCEGLTATLLADKDYQRDITRLALKYLSANDCKPEITVPLKIVTTAIQLHANAEVKERQAAIEQKLADPAITNKIAAAPAPTEYTAAPPAPPTRTDNVAQ